MASEKYNKLYEQLRQEKIRLTSDVDGWKELKSAGKFYKYSYADQLMINGQNPNATACAGYDVWNDSMDRYVKRGAKGIGLLNTTTQTVQYVFDIKDTGGSEDAKSPNIWEYKESYEENVLTELNKQYSINATNIVDAIKDISSKAANEYFNNNFAVLVDRVGPSMLEYEQDIIPTVKNSLGYALALRMNIDPSTIYTDDDLSSILRFKNVNTIVVADIFGNAVNGQMKQFCLTMAKVIAKEERSLSNEKSTIRTTRGLSNTDIRRTTEASVREIWRDEGALSGGERASVLLHSNDKRGTIPTTYRGEQKSLRADRHLDGTTVGETTSTRQERGPDGLGGSYEQHKSTSRGNSAENNSIQLKDEVELEEFTDFIPIAKDTELQLTLFSAPTQAEQKQSIDERVELEKQVEKSALEITPADINAFYTSQLVIGNHSRYAINLAYQQNINSTKEIVDIIKNEYINNSGNITHLLSSGDTAAISFDEVNGITFSVPDKNLSLVVSWESAEKNIAAQVKTDNYLSHNEKDSYNYYAKHRTPLAYDIEEKINILENKFGVDDKLLRYLIADGRTENNINSFGSYEKMRLTVDFELAEQTLNSYHEQKLIKYRVN